MGLFFGISRGISQLSQLSIFPVLPDAVCAGVGVSTLLAFIEALRRAGGFGFGAAFPLGDLGV